MRNYNVNLKQNWESCTGHITVPMGFRELDPIDQLDLLGDWIKELKELYALINFNKTY